MNHSTAIAALLAFALCATARAEAVKAGAAPAGALSASMPPSAATPRQLREKRGLKPGMVVLDHSGSKVGVIAQTGRIRDGRPAVLLDVDGAQFKVRTSKLKLTRDGEEATISLSKSQIRTDAILNTY
jgi:hypothetical protein